MVSSALAYRLDSKKIQHIRAHYAHTEGLAAMFLSSLSGVPYSITCHTVKIYFPAPLVREILLNASFVVADTLQVSKFLLRMGVPAERIKLIRNGVDLRRFQRHKASNRDALPTILAVGRLDPKKGFDVLIESCAILKKRGVQFNCLIVGDGSKRAALENQRIRLGLPERVQMLGNVPEEILRTLYLRASCLVMPSVVARDGDTDGLPTVLIEAMASGIPVIAANTAAIPEIVHDGSTGFLANAGDAESIAERICKCLADDVKSMQIADAGYQLVSREYDLETNVSKLAQILSPQFFSLGSDVRSQQI